MNAELKRPEVADAQNPTLQRDAWKKAISRGSKYFATCNFRDICVWETARGPSQIQPVFTFSLAPGLTHSSQARIRREEIKKNWEFFLEKVVEFLSPSSKSQKKSPLPPQAVDLRDAIEVVADDAALRIREAVIQDEEFRSRVLDCFRSQFGVELLLDPLGSIEIFHQESQQIALIACFVVATRLLLYKALVDSADADGMPFNLDPLDVSQSATDPQRVARDLANLYEHARRRTGNFEFQLRSNELDEIVFFDSPGNGDVGLRWSKLVHVINQHDWKGPAKYVPGLYESLLDERHRHIMGVHYTPDPVAELVAAYVVCDPRDRVLDPASGAGTFVTMCYDRKRQLGSTHMQALSEVFAVELADFAASLTSLSLSLADTSGSTTYPRVFRSDFFHTTPDGTSDLVDPRVGPISFPSELDGIIGNPPYIRFENRSDYERREISAFLHRTYVRTKMPLPDFTGKADVWAFFVAGAQSYLKPGGRLGFVLSWSLLSSDYGDAVLSFLGRYFLVDAIIDSRVERWFAAAQNTVILLARRAEDPTPESRYSGASNIPADHLVKFVRLKQPISTLLDDRQPRGKRGEDLIDELASVTADVGDDLRWDIRVFPQVDLTRRVTKAESR
ncbi:DNA methylase (Methyltransferase) [Mycobacteroides abscessus subsp. massiliense]|uniref:Eco57I restriction-modification methylase domain-containing protein n=1 Tax=Mycobacteroides abscessus TaxID=36809 RepID=UPI0009A7E537|nr:N-6 DNA methylase [Mycobacteroides abscessus]SKR09071.1 DNA methylase (Methyltransferase) [Mycobacteroides abscessus subsp. massiliense]SKR69106.1 DNA methylase (Methyltransferase) [Mycobacteroides abscessus subsp. massiliense]SKT54568.1 DNA methylase (Methyltransferase) [Mycobacteroides abscessus subsp. massiliense]SKT90486.1 DNA methylase (Methyltransferase) [Mycobacteroides abscessus subsp. massiliense]SLA35712.1 DNA methylase (Methyltransferase) [Mycobacteroides abscessus subsp. massili